MEICFDAFISYGRADSKGFATKLYKQLTARGFNVWFDQNDIPLAVDFQEQINDGIEKAHNFLFIIAPHSVNSEYCLKEINLAVKYNKRIIPLLHVEEITQEIWQQRNPHKTEDDWQEYQAKGLHSSFTNIDPTISKINWVYFREKEDDFDTSFTDLVATIHKEKEYVEQHTNYLNQGLEWLRNKQRTNYLLVGEEKQKAVNWLQKKFDALPPCTPTDIHCEFISESIKNANNLMTDVFLAYSDKDEAIKEKIRKSLMREGLTVWTNKTDIKTGITFQEAIQQGVERADHFVYLISPESINSKYCQQELAQAFTNNKHIIPLLIEETNLDVIPSKVRELQFIDFISYQEEDKYQKSIDKSLRELKQDSHYYEKHKILLVKALKWQRQNQNPSLLLRGYNLQHFEAWLKIAQRRNEHPSIPLQEEFINASLKQPEKASLEVFISYSRTDSDLARKLNDCLQELGKTTWFDQESIATGSDFQQEIYRGIESSDNFLFIISPNSINSPYCADEVEYAQKLNKRFVTILYRPLSVQDKQNLHPTLASVQWLDLNQHGGEFVANFNELVRTLDTDRDHVRSHTEWSQRALKWQKMKQDEALLLRGTELEIAHKWLFEAKKNKQQPSPTEVQQQFIRASQELSNRIEKEKEVRRQREIRTAWIIASGALFFLFVTTGLGLMAWNQKRAAQIEQIKALTELSKASLLTNEQLTAMVTSVKAAKKLKQVIGTDKKLKETVEIALRDAVYNIQELNQLEGHSDKIYSISFSPDGKLIASASRDGTVKVWGKDGKLLETLNHKKPVRRISFSPDGKLIASASEDRTVQLWKLDGSLEKTLQHSVPILAVTFSPKNCPEKLIASSGTDGIVRLWSWEGKVQRTFSTSNIQTDEKQVNDLRFSPDCQKIASASADKTIKLWDLKGNLLTTLQRHRDKVWQMDFSADGNTIVSASSDTTLMLWKRDEQGNFRPQPVKILNGHTNWVRSVSFSPDNNEIVSASDDHTIKIWDRDGTFLYTFIIPDAASSISFSSDGKLIAVASNQKIRLRKFVGMVIETLRGHSSDIKGVRFSPDGKLIASVSTDETLRLWERNPSTNLFELKKTLKYEAGLRNVNFTPHGENIITASYDHTMQLWNIKDALASEKAIPQRIFSGHNSTVNNLSISPDGKMIASASGDGTVRLWGLEKTPAGKSLKHNSGVNDVSFSPNGKKIVSVDAEGWLRLWSINGDLLQRFQGHDDGINALMFSPDGKFIATASRDKTIKLWQENEKGEFDEQAYQTLDKSAEGHEDGVWDVAFSLDGKMIASAGKDDKVKLWKQGSNNSKFELITTLQTHKDWVRAVSFSPNGKKLASASADKTIIVWNIKKINEIEAGEEQPVLDSLLKQGCDWLSNYLKTNQNLDQSDRSLCNPL